LLGLGLAASTLVVAFVAWQTRRGADDAGVAGQATMEHRAESAASARDGERKRTKPDSGWRQAAERDAPARPVPEEPASRPSDTAAGFDDRREDARGFAEPEALAKKEGDELAARDLAMSESSAASDEQPASLDETSPAPGQETASTLADSDTFATGDVTRSAALERQEAATGSDRLQPFEDGESERRSGAPAAVGGTMARSKASGPPAASLPPPSFAPSAPAQAAPGQKPRPPCPSTPGPVSVGPPGTDAYHSGLVLPAWVTSVPDKLDDIALASLRPVTASFVITSSGSRTETDLRAEAPSLEAFSAALARIPPSAATCSGSPVAVRLHVRFTPSQFGWTGELLAP
jgi:hypothetical protein